MADITIADTALDKAYIHQVIDGLNSYEISVLSKLFTKLSSAQISNDKWDTLTDEEYADCLEGVKEIARGEFVTIDDL